jgi:enoyl-CoA hydratase/carnithine racemase
VRDRKVTTYEVSDGVAVLTLNRPERFNAWTARMEYEYSSSLAEADADPDVRVVVVTGAGRGFCAGADTEALTGIRDTGVYDTTGAADQDDDGSRRSAPGSTGRPDFQHTFTSPLGLSKPLIAAVNGPAAGVGFVLLCFADIRFAAAGAKLTTSFGRLGLPAEHGVAWVLPRIVGSAHAADLLFSSRVVLAEEAERIGLVNRVLPADQLLDHTLAYAKRMAVEISPWSLKMMKRQLYSDLLGDLDGSVRSAMSVMNEAFARTDFKEGVAALTEKRAPNFQPMSPDE